MLTSRNYKNGGIRGGYMVNKEKINDENIMTHSHFALSKLFVCGSLQLNQFEQLSLISF